MPRAPLVLLAVPFVALACSRADDSRSVLQPMPISFASSSRSESGQWIDAAVAPDGQTGPTTFRLWLAPPGLAAKNGDKIRAVMRRADTAGVRWVAVMLGAAFYPSPAEPSSSGALSPIQFDRPTDSLSLQLSVQRSTPSAPWLAEARLANGGVFLLMLNDSTKRGELRAMNEAGDMRVFTAVATLLIGPR